MKTIATLTNRRDDYGVHEGYLLLADISGYTAFLTGTELEHAHEIIHELTTLIRERLAPPMRFVKLEGDAVFCHADTETFREGERLVELIEACYFEFSNRLLDMTRATTCRCVACAAIGSLGLKFVSHYGSYVVERDDRREDLAGPDVILAHRLLKNTISDHDGPPAYAFFTHACQQHLPPSFELPSHIEMYESFGETKGGVHDLDPVLSRMREERRLYISASDADFEIPIDVPVPPAVAWQYVVDPIERQRWACRRYNEDPDQDERNPEGRLGPGATSHCTHGPGHLMAFREFIDWRPFAYFTSRVTTTVAGGLPRSLIETVEFIPLGDHRTRIIIRYRATNRSRMSLLVGRATRALVTGLWQRRGSDLVSIVEEDVAALRLGGRGDPQPREARTPTTWR
ncbi:DUF2652 domain-containing protein [Mycobacterium sp. ITM-2016-00318]|uniref:DUF2652 domain-containing protein n=1 Tax=Mycobacterium sp. ITM-2016-00318 TaxID=2099693 RepID=UPI000CF93133|nr:DUF2652 domain-containing protein [Mycobacterium sp. ITM-2016-00318]WNG94071.1 DUF2652 domain-containing protein [Mycobacterium sp. ITM-2016-00318]